MPHPIALPWAQRWLSGYNLGVTVPRNRKGSDMKRSLLLLSIVLLVPVTAYAAPVSAGNGTPSEQAAGQASAPHAAAAAEIQRGYTRYQRGDYQQALTEWRLAAAQGYADAENNLGVMYAKGQGVPQDYATAVKWYRLAAAQGYADAECNLGVMYAKGQGVPQDYATAVKWYRLAAAQGLADAENNLGVTYLTGIDVQDSRAQIKTYLRAATSSVDVEASTNAKKLLEVLNATPRSTVGNEDCRLAWLRDALGKGQGILAEQEVLYVNHFAQSLGYSNLQTLFAVDGQQDGMLVALKYCRGGESLATALDIFALSNGY
jgi:hypothetical protein